VKRKTSTVLNIAIVSDPGPCGKRVARSGAPPATIDHAFDPAGAGTNPNE
jgi:hypothetical protein